MESFLMLLIFIKAKLIETRPLDVVRDAWRVIARAAYKAVGQWWIDNLLQKHFEPGAATKYGYASRSQAYLLRKFGQSHGSLNSRGIARKEHYSYLRKRDDEQPLQLSGYMRREVSRSYVIRGFPTRATVIMYGPNYMNAKLGAGYRTRRTGKGGTFTDYGQSQPDKVREMTTVLPAERKEMARVLEQEILKGIQSYRGTRVTE